MTVSVGQPVEDFTAEATGESPFHLEAHRGRQIVIYFYPKDSTPGCTTEGGDFRDNIDAFAEANTLVVGVSRDGLKSHENFKAKQNYPFELISDRDETVCRQFDVIKLKQMYGKEHLGVERSTFLIDAHGVLAHEWRSVKVQGHVDDVLAKARELNA